MEIENFANRNAPELNKYVCSDAPEGFNFVFVKNNEKHITLQEEVTYSIFDGLQILDKLDASSYKMEVGPGESKIILIKAKVGGF